VTFARRIAVAPILVYRRAISPLLPPRCKYAPSCSEYAAQAITLHGPGRGVRLALARVARCHPWHAGGHDPVPAPPVAVPTGAPQPADRSHRRS